MKPSPPAIASPYAMTSWKTLAKWLDVRVFTAAEWEAIYALPYAERRAAIARRRVPAMEVQRAAE